MVVQSSRWIWEYRFSANSEVMRRNEVVDLQWEGSSLSQQAQGCETELLASDA